MTIPAIFFGILVSTFLGAAFHLWKDGGLGRLVLFIFLAWIGFWAGHILGQTLQWTWMSVGPLRLGTALAGAVIFLLIGNWLSLIRQAG